MNRYFLYFFFTPPTPPTPSTGTDVCFDVVIKIATRRNAAAILFIQITRNGNGEINDDFKTDSSRFYDGNNSRGQTAAAAAAGATAVAV